MVYLYIYIHMLTKLGYIDGGHVTIKMAIHTIDPSWDIEAYGGFLSQGGTPRPHPFLD